MNGGGPHGEANAVADVNHGKMNGFIRQRDAARTSCRIPDDPACSGHGNPDVMGYHTAAEIPNYWTYARDFVLQDHMFEPVKSWSLPDHLYMVSAWSAKCKNRSPMSCVNDIVGPYGVAQFGQAVRQELTTGKTSIDLAWTDITWLLYANGVSWAYYVQTGHAARLRQRRRRDVRPGQAERHDAGDLEPAAAVRRRAAGPSAAQHPAPRRLPAGGQGGDPAVGQLDRPVRRQQRAPARQRPPRPGLCHRHHQRRHEEPGLELHRDLPELG